mmetsp:Transcript_19813/g.28674  ORF Transcript_19813/g.28674 Transcript_19813/m.28674 type:complete len:203 (+) Transcript_19813:153-761(+)
MEEPCRVHVLGQPLKLIFMLGIRLDPRFQKRRRYPVTFCHIFVDEKASISRIAVVSFIRGLTHSVTISSSPPCTSSSLSVGGLVFCSVVMKGVRDATAAASTARDAASSSACLMASFFSKKIRPLSSALSNTAWGSSSSCPGCCSRAEVLSWMRLFSRSCWMTITLISWPTWKTLSMSSILVPLIWLMCSSEERPPMSTKTP